ncbi:MAG: hypothetical protein KDA77_16695, partial [Planctomycetaceae bacterium]|nr:hypothetical protein [Planctomycetaceae bacterium]
PNAGFSFDEITVSVMDMANNLIQDTVVVIFWNENCLSSLKETIPLRLILEQNYPNPFQHYTTIPFQLKQSDQITLFIYTTEGELIKKEHFGRLPVGEHQYFWTAAQVNGSALRPGWYFYALRNQEGATLVKKMIMIE